MILLDWFAFRSKPGIGVLFWIGIAFLFNGCIFGVLGPESGRLFFTAYLLEKTLSLDNLFVFFTLFSFFGVSSYNQKKILLWGILGAIIGRISLLLIGISLTETFPWMYPVFGVVLMISAIGLWKGGEVSIERTKTYRILHAFLPLYQGDPKDRFWVRVGGKTRVTTLFLALLLVELFDLLFALDSVPAVLAVTQDRFLAYTSNLFAILGLRSLYVYLKGSVNNLPGCKVFIAGVLLAVGCKMLVSSWVVIPSWVFLTAIVTALTGYGVYVRTFRKKHR